MEMIEIFSDIDNSICDIQASLSALKNQVSGDLKGAQKYIPAWLPIAINEIGVKEIEGPESHPRIVEYLKTCESLPESMKINDETAWCSAYVNWCVIQAGLKGTNKANARSWLGWGQKIDYPNIGDIIVFYRGKRSGWSGHVGFNMGQDRHGNWNVLSGNQSDMVCVQPYPDPRVLGFRTWG